MSPAKFEKNPGQASQEVAGQLQQKVEPRNGGTAPIQCPMCLGGQLWVHQIGTNIYSYFVAPSGCLGFLGFPDTFSFPCKHITALPWNSTHLLGALTPYVALRNLLSQEWGVHWNQRGHDAVINLTMNKDHHSLVKYCMLKLLGGQAAMHNALGRYEGRSWARTSIFI